MFWSNFGAFRPPADGSDNFLASAILRAMGLPLSDFFAVNDAVRQRLPVISSYVTTADGRTIDFDALSESERRVMDDYALVQYDVLFGKQYLMNGTQLAARPSAR